VNNSYAFLPRTGGTVPQGWGEVSAEPPVSAQNDAQHALQAQASSMAVDLGKLRWLMFEQGSTSISIPLLAVLVFWLVIVFTSFGLSSAPLRNALAHLGR